MPYWKLINNVWIFFGNAEKTASFFLSTTARVAYIPSISA